MNSTNEEIAKEIVGNSLYLTLASFDEIPWVSPLFFAVTPRYEFVFISSTTSRHARAIRAHSAVSWCVFLASEAPESTDGVYFEGIAREIRPQDEHVQFYADVLYDRRFPDAAERAAHPANPAYWEETGRRLYVLTPTVASKVDKEDPAGVSRADVDLAAMIEG